MTDKSENYSTDELEAPEWLDANFIEEALNSSTKGPTIKVKNLELTPGTNKGDHYASIMFRAKVQYEQQGQRRSKSFIIKTMPDYEGHKQQLIKEMDAFSIEIGVYSEVLPKFEALLRAAGDDVLIAPKCVFCSTSPRTVIIFEDLVELGYSVIRKRDITLNEIKGIYYKLAKWHAAGYKLGSESPDIFKKYQRGVMTISNVLKENYVTTGIDNFIELLNEVPSLHEYKCYFESLRPNLIQQCKTTFEAYKDVQLKDNLFVLCHGDCHSRNMMFKYDPISDKFEDVLLLDYQICYKGPLANDLIYSYFMILSADQRIHNFDELLRFYFETFLRTLSRIGFVGRTPTMDDFKEQWKQSRCFEMFLLVTFLPLWDAFKSGDVEPLMVLNSFEYRKNVLYKSEKLIRELQVLLPRYKRLGYFD